MRRSVLELVVGGVPYAHGDSDGTWRYRYAVRPEGPTELDRQTVEDFLTYERSHGRTVSVVTAPELTDRERWPSSPSRPSPGGFTS